VEIRRCGTSALTLSALGLGCWSFGGGAYWGDCDQADADAVVRRAVELGITYFDAAEAYNAGRSEESLGKALVGVPREQVVIGTKVSPSNCYARTLPVHCEASLRRLGLEYVDLYMIHWPIHPHSIRHFTSDGAIIRNPPTVAEAFTALAELKRQGKIRHVGKRWNIRNLRSRRHRAGEDTQKRGRNDPPSLPHSGSVSRSCETKRPGPRIGDGRGPNLALDVRRHDQDPVALRTTFIRVWLPLASQALITCRPGVASPSRNQCSPEHDTSVARQSAAGRFRYVSGA